MKTGNWCVVAALCGLAVLADAGEGRELRFAPYAARRMWCGLGGEFPGAKGSLSYTNGAARLSFDFTRGGHYVTYGVGRLEEGAEGLSASFRLSCPARAHLILRGTDAKGDTYLTGTSIEEKDGWKNVSFGLKHLRWGWGPSTNAADRATVKWPLHAEILVEPTAKKLVGAIEAKEVRLKTAGTSTPDWTFVQEASRHGAVYYAGETVELRYARENLRTDGGMPGMKVARAVVTDWRDAPVCTRAVASQAGTLKLSGPDLRDGCGAFKVVFMGTGADGKEVALGKSWFAYLTGKTRPTPWCGTGAHGYGDLRKYEQMAACGIGAVRNDYVWPGCERTKGVYTPNETLQRDVAKMRALGIVPHMIFNGTNKLYENPVDHEAFGKWIRWSLDHDMKDVDVFEIWNESWNNYFGRTFGPYEKRVWIDRYVAFSKAAAAAVHAGRPGATVMVCTEDGARALEWMIEGGIAGQDDVISFHPYIHGKDPRPERLDFFFDDDGARIRTCAAAHGGAARLRITEAGWTTYSLNPDGSFEHWHVGSYPCASYVDQANYIVRAYLISRSAGVEAMMQYDFQDDGPKRNYTEHNFGLVFQDQTPKPSFAAVAFMTRLLGEAEPLGWRGTDRKTARSYAFRLKDGRTAYAMWAVEQPVEMAVPAEVAGGEVFDLMGNRAARDVRGKLTLTESPVYVVGKRQ